MSASKEGGKMQFHVFCFSDLDIDRRTLIYELENVPEYTKNELCKSSLSKITDRQTDRCDRTHYASDIKTTGDESNRLFSNNFTIHIMFH